VRALGDEMPGGSAVEELREMGFRAVLVHHPTRFHAALRREFRAFASQHPELLRPVHTSPSVTAYSIESP
jgi:hypothetical protein